MASLQMMSFSHPITPPAPRKFNPCKNARTSTGVLSSYQIHLTLAISLFLKRLQVSCRLDCQYLPYPAPKRLIGCFGCPNNGYNHFKGRQVRASHLRQGFP
jgi:hypothetical protein